MATTHKGRGDAVYAVVAAQPDFVQLTQAERDAVQLSLSRIFGADMDYLAGAVDVLPATLADPGGAQVVCSPTTGQGSVTTPVGITGKGKIV